MIAVPHQSQAYLDACLLLMISILNCFLSACCPCRSKAVIVVGSGRIMAMISFWTASHLHHDRKESGSLQQVDKALMNPLRCVLDFYITVSLEGLIQVTDLRPTTSRAPYSNKQAIGNHNPFGETQ
ncbi:MAG: hypothetical protein J3R72DRAFT_457055 [Linnemannia gamsii]|nr:MAG: hypothetical protein J3R72DRAFT_457055 [Linnemannia gamsii]